MTATLPPTFGLHPPDDSMEISSEYGNMDNDIDIDLDAPDTNMQSFQHEDLQMQEDPKSDRLDDDLMIDDSNLDDTDRMMQDDAPVVIEQDEELLDFSEDEEDTPMNPAEQSQLDSIQGPEIAAPVVQETVVEEPIEQVQSEFASELLAEGAKPIDAPQPVDSQPQSHTEVQVPVASQGTTEESISNELPAENVSSESHVADQEQSQAVPASEASEESGPLAQEVVLESTEVPTATSGEVEVSDAHISPQQPISEQEQEQEQEQGNGDVQTAHATEDDELSLQPTLNRQETDLSNYTVPEEASRERQPNSPTLTGMHPTIVEYQENEVYLFPSRDPAVPEQYLLQNENLVTTSLGDLLQACRAALGDSISEDEELVLGVEELDLYVSEDSTPAFSTSFSELLDMYLQLHKLDGNDNPPPFRVSLTTKTRFSNRLSSITQAISEGKGFSQLTFLQYYEYDEPTELPDEDFDDDFDESVKVDEEQHLIEGVANAQSEIEVSQSEQQAPEVVASEEKDQPTEQTDLSRAVESPNGEYDGEENISHEVPSETIDLSEYNQDDTTQYFDAEGDESELIVENQASHDDEHSSHEAQDVTGEVEDAVNVESSHGEQDVAEVVQSEPAPALTGLEETAGESSVKEDEHLFGQGEFFDEENYEFQDGEVHQNQNTLDDGDEVDDDDDDDTADQAGDIAGHEAQNDAVVISSLESSSKESAEVNASEDSHDDTHTNEESVGQVTSDVKNGSASVDGVGSEVPSRRHSLAVEDDDYDEINFDDEDEDGYEDASTELAPVTTKTCSKTSPGGKRSFSELDHVEEEQDSKKARAS